VECRKKGAVTRGGVLEGWEFGGGRKGGGLFAFVYADREQEGGRKRAVRREERVLRLYLVREGGRFIFLRQKLLSIGSCRITQGEPERKGKLAVAMRLGESVSLRGGPVVWGRAG